MTKEFSYESSRRRYTREGKILATTTFLLCTVTSGSQGLCLVAEKNNPPALCIWLSCNIDTTQKPFATSIRNDDGKHSAASTEQ